MALPIGRAARGSSSARAAAQVCSSYKYVAPALAAGAGLAGQSRTAWMSVAREASESHHMRRVVCVAPGVLPTAENLCRTELGGKGPTPSRQARSYHNLANATQKSNWSSARRLRALSYSARKTNTGIAPHGVVSKPRQRRVARCQSASSCLRFIRADHAMRATGQCYLRQWLR